MERVMCELAKYFCLKRDIDTHLILYGRNPELFYDVPVNLIIHQPVSKFNNKLRQFASIGRLLFLRKTIIGINPDSVLSFGEHWNSFVLMALLGLPYPVFISDRCSPEKKFTTIHTILRRVLYPKARGIIAQTEKAKQLFTSQFRHNNICVIGNPIRDIHEKSSAIERENIVLTIGRLIQSKHHDKLIELFAGLSIPDWKLYIVGDDALKQNNSQKLKELICRLNMDDKVILAGKQFDVESYFFRSKIFVFASSSEGFPNVIGEAMSSGLPVVAFDCVAGPSEMIRDGENGFIVPLFEFSKMREKLLLLMNKEELIVKLGNNAKESIKQFSPEIIGEKFYLFIMN